MSRLLYNPMSRRLFIQGLGGVIALPLLESLIPSKALAATASKKRFIAITLPNQMPANLFFPDGYPGQTPPADLASIVQAKSDGTYPYRQFNLADVIAARGQISTWLDSSYNSYANQIALYRGVDYPGRIDHGRAACMGNVAASHLGGAMSAKPMKTMDEFLMASTNFYTNSSLAYRFPVIRAGEACVSTNVVSESDPTVGLELGGSNAGLTFNGNLKSIFDAMYADTTSGKAKMPVVDHLVKNLSALNARRKLGTTDKHKLDEYMTNLSTLEASLNAVNGVQGSKPALTLFDQTPIGATPLGTRSDTDTTTPQYYADLVTLITLAMTVGATKVATIGFNSAKVNPTLVKSQDNGATGRNWHLEIAHAENDPDLRAVGKWVSDNVFLKLIQNLSVVESGGETYLDNTLIYFTAECSHGHSGIGMGGLLAGNKSGVSLGKAFEYADWSRGFVMEGTNYYHVGPGQPINRLWTGMLQSLGLQPSDYLGKFGNGNSYFGIWKDGYTTTGEAQFGDVMRSARISSPLAGLFV